MTKHKRLLATACVAAALAGCQSSGPNHKPFIAMGRPAQAPPQAAQASPAVPLPGMVQTKPFIAFSRPLNPAGSPTTLLAEHARSDSPVPLSEYPKQKTYAIASFDLRPNLSAGDLLRRLGPPAALADYADPWTVYRLTRGRELWLHFSQPDEMTLRSADVIEPTEDGYTRTRVFDTGLDQ